MKSAGQIIFWTVAAVFVIPAVVGAAACCVGLLLGMVVLLALLVILCLSCLPIIWWCGMWEGINSQQWLLRVKTVMKQPKQQSN